MKHTALSSVAVKNTLKQIIFPWTALMESVQKMSVLKEKNIFRECIQRNISKMLICYMLLEKHGKLIKI